MCIGLTAGPISGLFTPVVSEFSSSFLKSFFSEKYKKYKTNKEFSSYKEGDEVFREYFERMYQDIFFIKTIVFGNQPKTLNEIYVPLKINLNSIEKRDSFVISEYNNDFVHKYKKILITDTAGMGKSTLMKCLFFSCIDKKYYLPFFLELKKLTGERTIIDEICYQLGSINKDIYKGLIERLIEDGEFIFFFDGFDEISNSVADNAAKAIEDFISKAHKNKFIVTSREDSRLSIFKNFYEFKIENLSINEAYKLIKKYDKNVESKLERNGKFVKISDALIEELESIKKDRKNLDEFLTNPLLTSLLYKAYSYKNVISETKSDFYRQVFDALFEDHDLTKGGSFRRNKKSGLNISKFHDILKYFGFITLNKGTWYTKDIIYPILKDAREYTQIEFENENFLEDLEKSVPILKKEGDNYGWVHKSIQEYFASQFICVTLKNENDTVIKKLSDNISQYFNVLDLCFEMDWKAMVSIVVLDFIKEYIDFHSNSYLTDNYQTIKTNALNFRKSLLFDHKISFLINNEYEDINIVYLKEKITLEEEDKNILVAPYGYNGAISTIHTDQDLKVIRYRKNAYTFVIELLKQRKIDVLVDKNKFKVKEVYLPKEFKNLPQNKVLFLEDDNKSFLNSPENFEIINNLIFYGIENLPILDIDKCKELKLTIEQSIENEKKYNKKSFANIL